MPDVGDLDANEAIVRAMWLAHREDRIDDMLALIHSEIVWMPASRPGLSMYRGHSGVRAMIKDARAAAGDYQLELEEVTATADDVVRLQARVVAPADDGGSVELPIEMVITLRDGLVFDVETHTRTSPRGESNP